MFKAKDPATTTSAKDDPPKSALDKLFTTTPVVMTVVATLLAGLSSSEMTKAQYFRSLAAQNQSKVGDQWAFFQAKRARGTNHELTAKVLLAVADSGEFTPESLQQSAEQLAMQLQRGQANAEELLKQLGKANLGPDAGGLRKAATRLQVLTRDQVVQAGSLSSRLVGAITGADVKTALACIGTGEAPGFLRASIEVKDTDPQIEKALEEIDRRKTEQETHPVVALIEDGNLREAIRSMERHAKSFDDAGKPVGKALEQVDRLLNEQVRLAAAFSRGVRDVQTAADHLPTSAQGLAEVRQNVTALADNAATLRRATNELNVSFLAGQMRYHGWRYDQEARDNQRAAGLYEIEVRKSGWHAERHRRRSAYFFYGMLAAQAGVTIATLALAVRLRSVLWGLASVAGLVAIAIAGYVYLYV